MNKIAFRFTQGTLTEASLAEATYFNTLFARRPMNRLLTPMHLVQNSTEESLRFNQSSHLVATQRIRDQQPLLKIASEDCVSTARLNIHLHSEALTVQQKVEEIKVRILGEKPSPRNAARLDALLRWLVDYFTVRVSKDPSELPGLQLTADLLRKVGHRPSFLDLPQETLCKLLICDDDAHRLEGRAALYEHIAMDFGKTFPGTPKDLIVPAMVALRSHSLPFPDTTFETNDERHPHHSTPFQAVLRPSFTPNTVTHRFFDFTVNRHFILLLANRDIEPGEVLSVNCEHKGSLTRQPRLLDRPRLRLGRQPPRLHRHATHL